MANVSKIPEGYNTLTPSLNLNGAAKAIEMYKKAFGAEELYRMDDGKGKIMHACLQIGTSRVFLADIHPQMCPNPTTSSFYVYLDDVDHSFRQAKNAGLKELSPVQDMFWGDRTGSLEDSFGIRWTIATHVKDVSPQEMEEGKKKFASSKAAA